MTRTLTLKGVTRYAFPGQFLGDVNFGKIMQTRLNSERQVQLAARLTF